MMKNGSRANYPQSRAEMEAANRRAHVPIGPQMLDQRETGADALARAHRTVADCGMLTRPDALPGSTSSPLKGSVEAPYKLPDTIR